MSTDYFSTHGIKFIDYKDIEILKRFLNPHGRILARKRTGLSSGHQIDLEQAVKRARFMGLLPFVSR
ncbi:MAG: 30S ribosomal protein S18 [Parcubacteria group bacterium]|nr:30S ribosomal protein S18 [Parcubacteria group bacterium]